MAQKERSWFFDAPSSSSGDRFVRKNLVSETAFRNLLDSVPLFSEAGDEATTSQRGLIKLYTNDEVLSSRNSSAVTKGNRKAIQSWQMPTLSVIDNGTYYEARYGSSAVSGTGISIESLATTGTIKRETFLVKFDPDSIPDSPAPIEGSGYKTIVWDPSTKTTYRYNYDDRFDGLKFTDITDAPNSYSGNAGKIAAVNSGETGMEFKSIDTPTGLEQITEGGNTGWRLVGESAANHGDIGNYAVDLSVSYSASTVNGATGDLSFASGDMAIASGIGAVAFGHMPKASGDYSFAVGQESTASGSNSVAMGGTNTIASGIDSFSMGIEVTSSGDYAFGFGRNILSSGDYSFASGFGNSSSARLTVSGNGAWAHSYAKTAARNVVADWSAVLGGYDNATNSGADNAIVLGGHNQTAVQPNMVYIMGHKYWSYTTTEISALTSVEEGTVVYDTTKGNLVWYDGSVWNDLTSGTGTVTNVSSATTDQITVATGTTTPVISAVTSTVGASSNSLVKASDIYTFVMNNIFEPEYGSIYIASGSTINTTISSAGTWVQVTGFSNGKSANTTLDSTSITPDDDINAHVTLSMTLSHSGGTTGKYVRYIVYMDGTATHINGEVPVPDTNPRTIAIQGIIKCNASKKVEVYVSSDVTGTITQSAGELSVVKVGEVGP